MCLGLLFQHTLFLLPPLFPGYLNSQVIEIDKMVNSVNTTVDLQDYRQGYII